MINFLEQLLKLSLNEYTLYHLGVSLMVMEIWEYAEKIFNLLIKQKPKDYFLLKESEILSLYTGGLHSPENSFYLKKLQKLSSNLKEKELKLSALYYAALLLEEKKENVLAIRVYREILKINPNYRDVDIRLSSVER